MKHLKYTRQDAIGILTIDRPKVLNALNTNVIVEMESLLDEIDTTDIRCLIITGAGEKAFIAGADIGEMRDLNAAEGEVFSDKGNTIMEKIERLSMPTIAAVNGFALGGGCELALSCDIRIAAENASFSFPEVGLGITPGFGGVQRLVRTVGLAKAKELVFTTNRVKADEAWRLGLVNQVIPAAELMGTAIEMAQKIAANAPFAVRAVKKIANASSGLTLERASRLEGKLFGECFNTRDQKMGMTAFLEKRKPDPYAGE